MSRVIIIGAGGVGNVAAHKCCQESAVFTEILLASRTLSKCEVIAKRCSDRYPQARIRTAAIDANLEDPMNQLFDQFQPDLVINAALPYQNLSIMRACLKHGAHYVDTSAPEPDPEKYEMFAYKWQFDLKEEFQKHGLTAALSVGFDPGVTNVFCAYAKKQWFDEIHSLDILDCNAGDHGRAFATNFNPVTNIQEVIQPGMYWENGDWQEVEAFSESRIYDFPEIGSRKLYLIYHEELETLVERIPELKRARFWMGFSDSYMKHLNVLQNLGLTEMKPVEFEGVQVAPLEFLKETLPDPAGLGKGYRGKTNIGCLMEGVYQGEQRQLYVYNVCDHETAFKETGSQAISYTTGVPAMIAAKLILEGDWNRPGVWAPEDLDPDPMMESLEKYGLPWEVEEKVSCLT